ncbi:MAG: transporter substrate-binding domain-containing protein [Christensenellaceae bacterium]|jgi:polar amino acid transport system substrate-binding protein|nr:transporter substrate-binding domain-containing protein [Christensenellaceae bacterium]
MHSLLKKALLLGLILSLLAASVACAPAATQASGEPANRLEAIRARGYIEVATEPYFAPNEYIDPSKPEAEQIVGSDIELAKHIAKSLDVELRIVPLEFTAVLASIVEGKYDLAISGLAWTPARNEAMEMTKGYYFSREGAGSVEQSFLVREADQLTLKTPADLAGKTIAYQAGSLQEFFAKDQCPADAVHMQLSTPVDAYLAVQEGKADAAIVAISPAELYISANPDSKLVVQSEFRFTQDEETLGTRIGIPKGETELLAYINGIIDEILVSGDYIKWYDEHTELAKTLGVE